MANCLHMLGFSNAAECIFFAIESRMVHWESQVIQTGFPPLYDTNPNNAQFFGETNPSNLSSCICIKFDFPRNVHQKLNGTLPTDP